jgi:hypothetical protein
MKLSTFVVIIAAVFVVIAIVRRDMISRRHRATHYDDIVCPRVI